MNRSTVQHVCSNSEIGKEVNSPSQTRDPHDEVNLWSLWQVEEKKAATEVLIQEMGVQRAGAGELHTIGHLK